MGSELGDAGVTDAVRSVLYSAFSLIMMELVETDEKGADEWLRLTARGMRCSVQNLAMHLFEYNTERLARLNERYGHASND